MLLTALATLLPQTTTPPKPWPRHTIDPATKHLRGADGVRLADANNDGHLDTVTGWEEGRAIRICLHPGPTKVKQPWPAVTVGTVPNAEDAVFVDLDNDGHLDVISCTEGRTKTVFIHWAPKTKRDYLNPKSWRTFPIPSTANKQAWMFALPMQVDGKHGIDLILGSKGKHATISWLRSPENPRNLQDWQLHKITDAGWIMSLRAGSNPKQPTVFVTDRRGPTRGVYRLQPPTTPSNPWRRKLLGGAAHEVMFLDLWPKTDRPIVATRNSILLDLRTPRSKPIPNPFGIRHGKAVRLGDIDGDGELDLVHTANTGRQRNLPGVSWLRRTDGTYRAFDISGRAGHKFDRIELLDLDGDGDLDVMTCEENAGKDSRGLGLIWYENPHR